MVAQLAASCGDDERCDADEKCAVTSSTTSTGAGGSTPQIECPASGIYQGPWSLGATEAGAKVRWNGCAAGIGEVNILRERDGGAVTTVTATFTAAEVTTSYAPFPASPPDVPGTYYLAEAAITGLETGTCYRYELVADPARGGRFCTAHASGDPFRFMAIGDTNPGLGKTAGVLEHALAEQPELTLHLGDIQYYSSIVDSWAAWFPAMQPLLSNGGFFPSIGNHESENDTELADYYVRLFGNAGEAGGTTDYYRFRNGGYWFHALNSEISLMPGSPQAVWLEQALAEAQASPGFLGSIVYLHRPFLTVGDSDEMTAARAYLEPVFAQRDVRLVLQAHMHGYERFESGGVVYVTSGGGGGLIGNVNENLTSRPEEAALRLAAVSAFHSVILDASVTGLSGRAIDQTGAVIDSFSIPNE